MRNLSNNRGQLDALGCGSRPTPDVSLTDLEQVALDYPTNLADAHTHQKPSANAWARVHGRLSDLFVEATTLKQSESDKIGFEAYFSASGQYTAIADGWYLNAYAASVAIDLVAYCLGMRHTHGALIEPTFDNIPALLRKHKLKLHPLTLKLGPTVDITASQVIVEVERARYAPEFLFLVLPNNPTGHYIKQTELAILCYYARERQLTLVIDSCFRMYDPRTQFDYANVLLESGVSYIMIDDTGKVWPTADIKLSFITASRDWRNALKNARNDLLLNVSPLANLIVREYAKYHADNPSEIIEQTRHNRSTVRDALAALAPLRPICEDSRISVELIDTAPLSSHEITRRAAEQGLALLSGHRFYWSDPVLGRNHIRIALARDHQEITLGMELLRHALRSF